MEDLCNFARKRLTIHNLCKIDDSSMDAFSEIGPTVTDTLVTALAKLSTSQEAFDNRLNEMTKKFEERKTALSNQLEYVQKLQTENVPQNRNSQSQRASFVNSRGETSQNRGYRGGYRGSNGRGNRAIFQREPWGQRPRYQSNNQKYQSFNIQGWQNTVANQGQPSFPTPNVDTQQPTFEVFTPDPNYLPYVRQSIATCHKCGYPNHLAPNCTAVGPAPR